MGDGTAGQRGGRDYRFYAGGREVDLEAFLAAIANRGEAVVKAEDAPGYKVTPKGRKALRKAAG